MKRYLFIAALACCAMAAPAFSQTIVNQFSTGGSFSGGLEYDSATDTIWVADSTADMIYQFDRSGSLLQSFASPRTQAIGVGVDPATGNVWVGDESEYVDEIDSSGVPTGRAWSTSPTVTDVSGIAFDPATGHIFVSQDSGTRIIAEFDPNGNPIRVIDLTSSGSTDPDGLGYNPITQTFFLGEDTGDAIIEVDNNGNFLNFWDMGLLGISPEGVGVDPVAGMVFIAGGFDNTVYEVDGMVTGASFETDVTILPEAGGQANFTLNAGLSYAGRTYVIFGGITGTSPGTPLPGGMATLPINWDLFTNIVISLVNTSIFPGFMGTLDTQGTGTAQLNLPAVSGAATLQMSFAYALVNPWDFASIPVTIEIVP